MSDAAPPFAELTAPTSWHTVEFISDLHLQPQEPATFITWQHYLRESSADAIFILGDLFEVWVGDDARTDAFESRCAATLAASAQRRFTGFMAGNRDFLVGDGRPAAALLASAVAPVAPDVRAAFAGSDRSGRHVGGRLLGMGLLLGVL